MTRVCYCVPAIDDAICRIVFPRLCYDWWCNLQNCWNFVVTAYTSLLNLDRVVKSACLKRCSKHFKMQIFVQGEQTNVYDISPSTSIGDLKELISFRSGVPCGNQVLTYAGRPLQDENTLSDGNIVESATISLGVRILGGKKLLVDVNDIITSYCRIFKQVWRKIGRKIYKLFT